MFPVDLIHCILESVDPHDKATQFKAAQLSKTWMDLTLSHFPQLTETPHSELFQVLKNGQVIPWMLLGAMNFEIKTWEDLLSWAKPFQQRFADKRMIKFKEVSESKLSAVWRPEVTTQSTKFQVTPIKHLGDYRQMVLPQILYRIWHSLFTKVMVQSFQETEDIKDSTSANPMGAQLNPVGGSIMGMLPTLLNLMNTGAKGKTKSPDLLNEMTQFIMTEFRRDLLIDEKFIECCFKNKLEKTLYHLLDYKRHYKFRLPENQTLEETYMLMAAKCDDIDMFCNMLASVEVTITHFTWITRNAPIRFLLSMIKVRKSIPCFATMVNFLDQNLESKSWKQIDFLKRAKADLY